jgi:pullulanase
MASFLYNFDLLDRRRRAFCLWIPGKRPNLEKPQLMLGTYEDGRDHKLEVLICQDLVQSTTRPELWELKPTQIESQLMENRVYHYWFKVQSTSPESAATTLQVVADPLAFAYDYRICFNAGGAHRAPAATIIYRGGELFPCHLDGTGLTRAAPPESAQLAENRQLVIYELPVSWVKSGNQGFKVDKGTFADVKKLLDDPPSDDKFAQMVATENGRSILSRLGVNAIELLPAADAIVEGTWGYATAHYFAPDADLGTTADLVALSETMGSRQVRLFIDVVMAFGHDPYQFIDFSTFHIRPGDDEQNPDSKQSGRGGKELRKGFGGESWRYVKQLENTYNPEDEGLATLTPTVSFHVAHLTRWMKDFGISGLRIDSVNNIANWDFVEQYYNAAHALWPGDRSRFLVIGEELSMPGRMLRKHLDALWNEPWQRRVRAIILGKAFGSDSFEWTVRKMVDSRQDSWIGFSRCTQAINYITSHDVEGEHPKRNRLCNYLWENKVTDAERRAKLAHVCLLTSFGTPMILAGEEFCDEHDLDIGKQKQVDPVNWSRFQEPWRQRVFNYVARLVHFRASCPALGEDDTEIIHVDHSRRGKIVAWKRGGGHTAPVIVVANFSDEDILGTEYVVPNWQDRSREDWREVTTDTPVPRERVGKEPLRSWEAKVYTYWRP